MSDAATTSDRTPPGHAAHLLVLLQQLIAYGKELADTLRQNGAAALSDNVRRFGTTDLALILARITRGLRLADALRGRITVSAAHIDAPPKPARAARTPRQAARQAAAPKPPLPDLPTAEQIAAAVRGRPIGAVIADICRDLGIMADHPLWRELRLVVICHGGNLAKLMKATWERAFERIAAAWPTAPLQSPTLSGAGPP